MNRSRRTGGFIAALVIGVLAMITGTSAQAHADGSSPAGQTTDELGHRSATVSVSSDELRDALDQITIVSPTGESMPVTQATPSCPGEWWNVAIYVQWWYDTATRQTLMSEADWGGQVNCTGMAYMSASSAMYFRFSPVAYGSTNTCGTQGAPSGICGSTPTSGEWSCTGIGLCNGNYSASMGFRVDLPAGWTWGTTPPAGCSIEFGGRTLLCVQDTGTVYVPPIN